MVDHKRVLLVIFFLVVSGMIGVYLQMRGCNKVQQAVLPRDLPMKTPGWTGISVTSPVPPNIGPGDYLLKVYTGQSGRPLNVLALYRRNADYHPPALCYRGAGLQLTEIPTITSSSGRIRLAGLLGKRNRSVLLIFHGFYIDGKVVPDGLEKKLYEIEEKLTHGCISQFFFEVTMNLHDDPAAAVSYIKKFLDEMEPYILQVSS